VNVPKLLERGDHAEDIVGYEASDVAQPKPEVAG
jgi:hypothetical protein